MIWLAYHDETERTDALIAMARGCQRLAARLAFLGPETSCEATRAAVERTEAGLLPLLSFRPLDVPEPRNDQAWPGTIEVIRAALLETSAMGSPVVAWIESPLVRKRVARAKGLRSYNDTLAALIPGGGMMNVINAFRLADVSDCALQAILDSSRALVNAHRIVPCCPSCMITRSSHELAPASCDAASQPTPDPIFTPLFQAEKLVALGQLGAGVAHELGNPLSIISSSLQYLHQRLAAANDPASDFTATALNNVERMRGLLGSMLDFAAVKKPRSEQVDLKDAISEVLRFTSPECTQRGIAVKVSFDPFVPKAWGDPGGLKQIVLNLVKNALDAMTPVNGNGNGHGNGNGTKNGHMLRVRTRMGAKRTALVEVENSGAAIPDEILPNLFRPFFTTKDGGTGLGLYLSRRIAEDHGGQLGVENMPGGVRFTLNLPLDRRKR